MTKYKLAFVIERYFEFGGLQRDMRRFAVAGLPDKLKKRCRHIVVGLGKEKKFILANDGQRQEYAKNGRDYCQNADIYSMIEKGVQSIVNRAEKNRGTP